MMHLLPAFAMMTSLAAAETLLFVDDHEILYRPATQRVLHQPVRHAKNPLLVGATIKNQVAYCSVHHDAESKRWQIWYQVSGGGMHVAYAESKDGIAWTKPALDLITNTGNTDRNLVFTSHDHYGASVVVDPAGGDASRRYKMAYWSIPERVGEPSDPKEPRGRDGGMYVAFSPDGIHWTAQPGPVLRGTYGRIANPPRADDATQLGVPHSVSDVIDATYDATRKKYVVTAKGWIDGPDGRTFWKRGVVRTESDDFIQWSAPVTILAPDEHDGVKPGAYPGTRQGVQLHSAPAFLHDGVWFGLIQLADFETDGSQPIELALSRDGLAWSRPFRGTPFIPVGRSGCFDAMRIWSNATPVMVGDEMRFYFGGAENPWSFGTAEREWGSKKKMPQTGLGLATLPRDRFAGLRPLERIGQITLKPRSLAGVSAITVNADARKAAVRVELLDASGHGLPGFSKADAVPLTGDQLHHEARWNAASLKSLPAGEVMLRLHLDRAEVFAITLQFNTP